MLVIPIELGFAVFVVMLSRVLQIYNIKLAYSLSSISIQFTCF